MPDFQVDKGYQWYEYLDNFFNVEPFSIITEMNKLSKKRQSGKRLTRNDRRKIRTCREKLRPYMQKWGSDGMQEFRQYITNLLESVFSNFGDKDKYSVLSKEQNIYYKQRSFFIVYDMLKKYLRSITNNDIYSGALDNNIINIISRIGDYPAAAYSSSGSSSSGSDSHQNYLKMSRMSLRPGARASISGSIGRWSRRSKFNTEEMDKRTEEAVNVLSAAVEIHKDYVKTMTEQKTKEIREEKGKLDKFKRIMKKKIFALAKGSKIRRPKMDGKMDYIDSPDNFRYKIMKKEQEIKAKKISVKRAAREACKNIMYRYSSKRKTTPEEKKINETTEKVPEEDDFKSRRKREQWENYRHRMLTVRKVEMDEGDRVMANIKKIEKKKKKDLLAKCREGFEELFTAEEDKTSIEDLKSEEWTFHQPSSRFYYERESSTATITEQEEPDVIDNWISLSTISGDVTPPDQIMTDISKSDEESPISDSNSVITNEHYLDDISDCFREIEDGAYVSSSVELAKSCSNSESDEEDPNKDACIEYDVDGLGGNSKFFLKIKKKVPEKLRSYKKEEELSVTSELMQQLCETSGSETSDTTYYFQPPQEKVPEEKPEIIDQPINFRDFNHRKMHLYFMEKKCKASDVSSVSEFNVWNKAIFKIKQREKYYYKKIGVSEAHEKLKRDIKHLIHCMMESRFRRNVLFKTPDKEDFSTDINRRMFEKINIDENKIFPIASEISTNGKKEKVKNTKQDVPEKLDSEIGCPSGSCLISTETPVSSISDESAGIISQAEMTMNRLNVREPRTKDPLAVREFDDFYRKTLGKSSLPYPQDLEMKRPHSVPIDARKRKSTIDEIVTSMFRNDYGESTIQHDGIRNVSNKYRDTYQSNKTVNKMFFTDSNPDLFYLFNKLHPEEKSGLPSILSTNSIAKSKSATSVMPSQREYKLAEEKKGLDEKLDVESLLSRGEKSIEDDYYSIVKRRQASDHENSPSDVDLEYRIKTRTLRYVTLKSERKWPKHYFPDYRYFFRSLLQRRILVSFVNINLRTNIPFLKPDNELFELPHYALLSHLRPPITYETTEKIEDRILWDRPEKYKIYYSEVGDKHFVSNLSQTTMTSNQSEPTNIDFEFRDMEQSQETAKYFDYMQTKDLNWLTWNAPEFNFTLTNKLLKRTLLDLGSAPDVYEKFNIMLKNRKLGYEPMKELLSSNQEKLFNYICSQFLNKLAVKYPKRFLRLLFFAYNQHGVQKHICTFIKPTRLKPPRLADWQGCARFISNRFHITPLSSIEYPPLQLNGPDKTLYTQTGNIYELGILLVCMLLGAGYDAYVVSGKVTQVRASGIMEDLPPQERDTEPPKIEFERKQSVQPITIERFFQQGERNKLAERLGRIDYENLTLMEETYIETVANKKWWKDDYKDKYQQYVGKMETPEGLDLIEKLKQEIKERQLKRKSTKELEKLLNKLHGERVKYLQEKKADMPEEDAGALEEECKKYLYPPDVEIKSVYVEKMENQTLKESKEAQILQKKIEEEKKQKENEEEYFEKLYSMYQTTVYLPPIPKTQSEYQLERYKFLNQIRDRITLKEQKDELDKIHQEERLSFEQDQKLFMIRHDIYELYFGERPKKVRARKIKKSETGRFQEKIDEVDLEKKHSETQIKETDNKAPDETEADEIDTMSEEMSEEELGELSYLSEKEMPIKKKINKKAVRRLRAKMERAFTNFPHALHEMPKEEPEPIKKIKAIQPVIYCWILIKKNDRDLLDDAFLDIKSGILYPTDDKQYLRIDCVWNDKNYYIPFYQRKHIKRTRMFDFKDDNLWWHLLCGEPRKYQQLRRSMRDVVDPMIQKHLSVPRTWVGHMKFPKKRFDKLFKDQKMKSFRYKRCRIDLYEYGAKFNGIRKRVTQFYDMEQTIIQCIRETFEHRNDFLIYIARFYRNQNNTDIKRDAVKITEVFEPGRTDNMKCYRRYQLPKRKHIIEMFFYADLRPDYLKMVSISEKRLKMQFIKGRTDQIVKLKVFYFKNGFFHKRQQESRFDRILAEFHQQPEYVRQLTMTGDYEDPPLRLDIDMEVGLSYYFFKDEREKELKYAMWELHYNLSDETFIDPKVQPNRIYFFGSSEERKSTLGREIMLEREESDKNKYIKLAQSTEREIRYILRQRKIDKKHVSIDHSRKSKWSPGVIEKLKIEQLYLMAKRVENRINNLREKNILNYFEDLGGGKKLDFVLMQILKSMAGDEFNLKLALFANQMFRKYQKALQKGCPSAKTFASVADKICKYIDAYRLYYEKHSQEAAEYYDRYIKEDEDDSEMNSIRKHIYGEKFVDDLTNMRNVIKLFSPKSMELWFDKYFKKEIKKQGINNVREMVESIDEILLLNEPNITKTVNTSFWKALGEFKHVTEESERFNAISSNSSSTTISDSDNRKEIESTDTDTDELCEKILDKSLTVTDQEAKERHILIQKMTQISYTDKADEKEQSNLEEVFFDEIKKLVKRYGIMNLKEGLTSLGMEKYLYNLQKEMGSLDCQYLTSQEQSHKLECFKEEVLRERKISKESKAKGIQDRKNESEIGHSDSSMSSFHDKIDRAISQYPWNLKLNEFDKDLKIMTENLEKEMMKFRLKKYPPPKPLITKTTKTESSMEPHLPEWGQTQKIDRRFTNMLSLMKKSMEGKMGARKRQLLKNIVYKLILKNRTDTKLRDIENISKKLLETREGQVADWNRYSYKLKKLLSDSYRERVIEHTLNEYKIHENYQPPPRNYNDIILDDLDVPTEQAKLQSNEIFSEEVQEAILDPFKGLQKCLKDKGYLLHEEDILDKKNKLKALKKERSDSTLLKKDPEEKSKRVPKRDEVNQVPEIRYSGTSL